MFLEMTNMVKELWEDLERRRELLIKMKVVQLKQW
jgi:hypothetical protein